MCRIGSARPAARAERCAGDPRLAPGARGCGAGSSGGEKMSAEQMRLAYRVEHGDGLTLDERKEAAQLVRDGALYRQCAKPTIAAICELDGCCMLRDKPLPQG